jgi:hypothetical protein
MKKILSVLVLTFFLTQNAIAQVAIGTNTPSPSAQFEIYSTERGFLPPRMTSAQRDLIVTPATGLLIFQTDNTAGYYFYNGTAWVALGGNSGSNGVTIGQMNYWNGSAWVSLPPGTEGQVLSITQGVPTWSAAPSLNAGLTPNVNTNTVNYDYNSYIFSLNGVLLPGPTNTDHGFVWSTNPNPTIQNSFLSLGAGTIGSNFTGQANISQYIAPNTTYYFRAYAANNYGVGYGNVLSFTTGPYLIGQNFQGGQIVRLDNTGLHGYIISSELGNSTWGCQGQNIGGTSSNIGTGLQNSTLIAANCAEINIAAKKCLDYSIGAYNDWYLPSSNEFSLITIQNFQLFGIPEGAYYHTSTQIDAQYNNGIVFYSNGGGVNQVYKSQYWNNGWQIITCKVRAFRNF